MKMSRSQFLAVLLLGASVVTTVHVGAIHDPVHRLHSKGVAGLTYAIILLGLLGIHELGHFAATRWRRIAASLPIFIPWPMGLGTFGAFVRLKAPVWDRNDSFDIAAAGPIAGLVVAIPLTLYSLSDSQPNFSLAYPHSIAVRSSLFLSMLYKLAKGGPVPEGMIGVSDLGFAAWIVIFVSALNLLPVGPLDGGRISAALLGAKKTGPIGFATVAAVCVIAIFVWSGLLFWAALMLILAFSPPLETLDEFTVPRAGRHFVGWSLYIFALLVLLPAPGGVRVATFTCPYM